MNCHTYTSIQSPRGTFVEAWIGAARAVNVVTGGLRTYTLSGLVGPGHGNSTGKARKEER